MNTSTKENTRLVRAALILLALAMLGATYLLYKAFKHGPVAGCGEGSGCDIVLKSHYAYLLPGVPVTVPALLVYAALFYCLAGRARLRVSSAWRFTVLCGAFLILAAAVWFIGIQAIKIKAFCLYCMGTHLLGGTAAILTVIGLRLLDSRFSGTLVGAGLTAGASMAALIVCQDRFPQKTYLTADIGTAAVPEGAGNDAEEGTGRTISAGAATIPLGDTPFRGNAESDKVLVLLFDYTCGSCRTTHRYLHRAEERFGPANFLIVGLPVPLNPTCNPDFTSVSPDHAHACEHARLALALWRLDREAFREWDHWMFETGPTRSAPTPAEALTKAESLVDPAKLKTSREDPWVDQQLARNIAVWKANKEKVHRGTMPQMVLGTQLVVGAPDSEFQLYDLMRDSLGLTPVNQ